MALFPAIDESVSRLRRAGWNVGEVCIGPTWLVTGTNGEHVIHAEAHQSGNRS